MFLIGRFLRWRLLPLHQFDVETERLQFADEHVERFRHTRLDARLALDDGLVNLGAAINVVGLCREQLLQDVRGAVRLERPHFHFTERLTAALRLAAQRLLRDKRVRTDGARMNLVVDKVRKLQHVDVADRYRLIELIAGHAVEQVDLAGVRQARNFEQVTDFRFARAVKYRRGERNAFAEAFGDFEQIVVAQLREHLPDRGIRKHFAEPAAQSFGANFLAQQTLQAIAEFFGGPAKVRFQNLPDVHTRRNAQRVQNDLDRSAIRKVRHIFLRNDARNHALVAVPAGHLVANG